MTLPPVPLEKTARDLPSARKTDKLHFFTLGSHYDSMAPRIRLHLTDFFWNTNYTVELEKDLSLKQQFLDAIIIEQISSDPPPESLPDGFDNLSTHNLLSYKSLREPMDAWALGELIGHFVNYRKQISLTMDDLLPVDQFSLYAVCTRHPDKLIRESKHNKLHEIQTGVFDVQWGVRSIRLLVLNKMPAVDRNAIWQLFSSTPKEYVFGQQRYRWKMSDISNIIKMLYSREVLDMTYTVEDFQRDLPKELLTMLTDEQRSELVDNLSVDEMLNRLSPEERIRDLSPDEMLKHLSPKERQQMLELLSGK